MCEEVGAFMFYTTKIDPAHEVAVTHSTGDRFRHLFHLRAAGTLDEKPGLFEALLAHPGRSLFGIVEMHATQSAGPGGKARADQDDVAKIRKAQSLRQPHVFFLGSLAQFRHFAEADDFPICHNRFEIPERGFHARGVRVVGVEHDGVAAAVDQLRPTVVRFVSLDSRPDLFRRNAEVIPDADRGQYVLEIVSTDDLRFDLSCHRTIRPAQVEPRQFAQQLAPAVAIGRSAVTLSVLGAAYGDHFRQVWIVVVQENELAVRADPFVQLAFPFLHAFESAEAFKMRLTHVRDEAVVRLHDLAIRRDLLLMIGAHFDDREFDFIRDGQDGQRYAYVIVQISFRRECLELLREYRAHQFLRRRLPVGTGNGQERNTQLPAMVLRQQLQAGQHILHQQTTRVRDRAGLVDHRKRGAGSKRFCSESVPVEVRSLEGEKKATRHNCPGIRADNRMLPVVLVECFERDRHFAKNNGLVTPNRAGIGISSTTRCREA